MIETFYGTDRLVTSPGPQTFFVSLVIGIAFGFALERAGFGSSRRLAGIFYFRNMTVLKVMFTALVTGMLGLTLAVGMGWLDPRVQISLLTTNYGAQAIGGLIFGVGFVMSGWCPGTAAVGMASGKLDAVVFLGGSVIGAILYNETYGWTTAIRSWGATEDPVFAFGLSRGLFGVAMTVAAIGAFYLAEFVEKKTVGTGTYLGSPFLKAFSLALLVSSVALLMLPGSPQTAVAHSGPSPANVRGMLTSIEQAEDHFEPEELADRLVRGDSTLHVIDVREPSEYAAFHIRGAINVPLPDLVDQLAPFKNDGTIVLYSNGMTHAAQARDLLAQVGFANAYMLTGGVNGFVNWCLKPVSLRTQPLPADDAQRVRAWRAFFLPATDVPSAS